MNKVMLLGRLTANPELRYTNSNVPFVRFSVAVNRQFNNQDGTREADFINCLAWRKTAELISKYFSKGSQIAIEGRLQTGSYDDKDGNKRHTTDVVIDEVTFVDKKPNNQSTQSEPIEETEESDPFADFGDIIENNDNYLE